MAHPYRIRLVLSGVIATLSLITVAFGQTREALPHPGVMRMIVSGGPFYWVFLPNQRGNYDAVLSNAAANGVTVGTGTMALEKVTPDSAVIRIVAGGHTATAKGKTFGATGVLSGTWSNDIGDHGNFTAVCDPTPPDLSRARNGQGPTAITTCEEGHCAFELPAAMKFCGPYNCQDLRLNHGKYESVGPDGNPSWSIWTVEQFDIDGVRIIRADPDGYTATLTGKISKTGNSIIDGVQAGNRGGSAAYQLTWGSGYGRAQKTEAVGSLSGQRLTPDDVRRIIDLTIIVGKALERNQ